MSNADHRRVAQLTREGASEEALSVLEQLFKNAELAVAPARPGIFMTMFQLQLLAEKYEPARAFLRDIRATQAERLLAGDIHFGLDGDPAIEEFRRIRRFSLIVEINDILEDHASTCEVFSQLDSGHPELARRYAWAALPALVAEGHFELADRYRDDPLKLLDAVNETALSLPLHPPPRQAPRLAAELSNLVRDVRIGIAVLRGTGHRGKADLLGPALVAGLDSDELKALARRELDAPGTITREIGDRQTAQEAVEAQPPG
ncbi:hypothetical protein NHH73_13320 [Oxalobacteraceae bacterium OTU3CINTB1]|nr:hypothetical protein NHH73_13320 [Oxalobacteraceae bacterium OTU3CINTB1]